MKVEFSFTRLSLRTRFVIAFLLYALAALLQALLVRGETFPLTALRFAGLLLLFIPILFLKVRNFPNGAKPKGQSKNSSISETWRSVSVTELDRLRDRISAIRKAKVSFIYSLSFGIIPTFIIVFLLFPVGGIIGAAGVFIILDLYLIFFPFFWFARVEKRYPAIRGKIAAFTPILDAKLPDNLRLEPMLLFRDNGAGEAPPGDASGKPAGTESVPVDMRLMIVPGTKVSDGAGDELVGAQFQVTFNNGPNGAVPYIYAVFITRGKGKTWERFSNVRAKGFVTEPGSSTEGNTVYGTVVLRQDTESRVDGYQTSESDIRKLLDITIQALG